MVTALNEGSYGLISTAGAGAAAGAVLGAKTGLTFRGIPVGALAGAAIGAGGALGTYKLRRIYEALTRKLWKTVEEDQKLEEGSCARV